MESTKNLLIIALLCFCKIFDTQGLPSNYQFPSDDLKFMVGKCSAELFFKAEQKCAKVFFLSIRENFGKVSDCSANYAKMRTCKKKVFEDCLSGSLVESYLGDHRDVVVQNYLKLVGNEDKWCNQGGLGIPEYIYKGTHCHPIFAYTAKDCVSRYQNVFNSHSSYSRLCREYNNAQTCLFRNLITHCSFTNRPLRQMMALLIEAQYDYQPYCFQPRMNARTYDELSNKNDCPRYAHADVMFLLDASKQTSIQEFIFMKRLIRRVAVQLNYGMSGIHVGVEQFNEKILESLQLDEYDTRRSFLRGLIRTRRMNASQNGGRQIGEALIELANNQFNLGETSSKVRPFHTPIIVVLTTGQSDDIIKEEEAVQKLINKGVRVIRFGPTYKTNRLGNDITYHVNNTSNFTGHMQNVVEEICLADKLYRDQNLRSIEEELPNERKSVLDKLTEHIFSRVSGIHLPLLWRPDDLEFIPFTILNNTDYEEPEIEEKIIGPPVPPGLRPLKPAPRGSSLVNPLENMLGLPQIDPFRSPGFTSLSELDESEEGFIEEEVSNSWGRFR